MLRGSVVLGGCLVGWISHRGSRWTICACHCKLLHADLHGVHLVLESGGQIFNIVGELAVVLDEFLVYCVPDSVCLVKIANAFLEKPVALFVANFLGIHSKAKVICAHGLLLEFCAFLPENFEVNP